MQVKDVMTRDVEILSPDQVILDAAQLMREVNTGFLPVAESGTLVGTLTDRDIVTRSIAAGHDPKAAPVREAMSEDVISCFEDDDVTEAAALMGERQIRRLPVLNSEQHLVGVVSLGDIAQQSGAPGLAGQAIEDIAEPTSEPRGSTEP